MSDNDGGRKGRGLWGVGLLVGVGLMGAGAALISEPRVERMLGEKALEALKSGGQTWASVRVNGREATLQGAAPSHKAVEIAREAVQNVRGIRLVRTDGVQVSAPTPPTIRPASATRPPLVLTGTWKPAPGMKLVVELAGKRYELGKAPQLKVEGDSWTLKLDTLPPDGVHDVVVIVTENGNEARDATRNELRVDTTPPAAPTFESASRADGQWRLAGAWPEGDAQRLVVIVDGKPYELGKNEELASDGKGHWTLTLPAAALEDGPHDVRIVVTDAAGLATTTDKPKAFTVDTIPPGAPTVDSQLANNPRAVISGSWPATEARSLEVELDGRTYRLGETDALKVKDGHWRLYPDAPLAEGEHVVVARTLDAAGNKAESSGRVIIDTTPPTAPSLTNVTVTEGEKPVLSGNLPADVKGMKITIHGKNYALDAEGSPLVRTGDKWKLALPEPLPVGAHDALVEAVDEAGNTVRKTWPSAIVVKAAPKPEPEARPIPQPAPEAQSPKMEAPTVAPTPAPVADVATCRRDINAWLKEHPVRFASDGDRLTPEGKEAMAGLAALMKKCPGLKFHIVGHTDSTGGRQHNKELSERRAASVKEELVSHGIAAERLSTEGAGESRPQVSNRTRAGRAHNRRIEIIVVKP